MADLLGLRIAGAIDSKAGGGASAASQATVDAGTNTTEFVNPSTLANAGFHGKYHKNLLYHSLTHHLWQEGDTFNDIADDTYVADVWNVVQNGQAPDITSVAGSSTDPLKRFFRCTFDSASSQAGIAQFLTSEDSVPHRGQTVSISADLWGTNITTLRMAVLEWQGTADAITSDVVATWGAGNPTLATNWVYLGTPAAITITTGRARYEVENLTVGIGANNLAVFIWTDAVEASGDLWNVARVQLERGPVATEFVARSYDEELAAVGPFAEAHGGDAVYQTFGLAQCTAATTGFISIAHKFMKRIAASGAISTATDFGVTNSGGTVVALTGFTFISQPGKGYSIFSFTVAAGLTAGNAGVLYSNNSTNARIYLTARL